MCYAMRLRGDAVWNVLCGEIEYQIALHDDGAEGGCLIISLPDYFGCFVTSDNSVSRAVISRRC